MRFTASCQVTVNAAKLRAIDNLHIHVGFILPGDDLGGDDTETLPGNLTGDVGNDPDTVPEKQFQFQVQNITSRINRQWKSFGGITHGCPRVWESSPMPPLFFAEYLKIDANSIAWLPQQVKTRHSGRP